MRAKIDRISFDLIFLIRAAYSLCIPEHKQTTEIPLLWPFVLITSLIAISIAQKFTIIINKIWDAPNWEFSLLRKPIFLMPGQHLYHKTAHPWDQRWPKRLLAQTREIVCALMISAFDKTARTQNTNSARSQDRFWLERRKAQNVSFHQNKSVQQPLPVVKKSIIRFPKMHFWKLL